MANKMLIDATHPEETRVVVLRGNRVEEFDFESAQRKQLRGNIYLAKVTRVEPSLQAAFVDYGGNRHGFLAFSEIHPDYYQIPVADRQALIDEEERAQRAADDEADRRSRRHRRPERPARRRDAIVQGDAAAADEDPAGHSADESSDQAHGDSADHEADHEIDSDADDDANGQAAEPANTGMEASADDAEAGRTPGPFHDASQEGSQDGSHDRSHDTPAESGAAATDHETPSHDGAPLAPADGAADATYGGDAAEQHHRGARNGEAHERDDAAEEEEIVESVGGADALEEVPDRAPRYRRQYKIQEVIKRRQVMLVQVVKEERGTKGAALTTYLSLAGRYSVLMPNTARGGGISRKITNSEDRSRLKEAAAELEVPEGMGVILRTAGASRTKIEIKRDFEYLLRMWETVRDLTLKSTAPKLVYEEGSLVKRSIRDLYTKDIDDVIVAGPEAYHEAKDFMRMLMPSHARNVHLYVENQPLLSRYGVENQLDAMFSPVVQLRSGGYIVLNQAEALVAIDVNSGRATREHHIEDTALKTNLEASDEISRQLRLRDLAGLIVIDFIDMDEKRNNRAVERRLKECLKHDRARIQVGRISHFGLLEMSRQRIRTSVLESSTEKCPYCGGSGHVRSVSSLALQVLRALEDQLMRGGTHNLIARTRPDVALYLLNQKRAHLRSLEERFAITITISSDESVRAPQAFVIDRGEQVHSVEAARALAERAQTLAAPVEDEEEADDFEGAGETDESESEAPGAAADAEHADHAEHGEGGGPRRRRRRRGRRGGRNGGDPAQAQPSQHIPIGEASDDDAPGAEESVAVENDTEHHGDDEHGEGEPEGEFEPQAAGERDETRYGERRRRRGRRGGRRNRHRNGEREASAPDRFAPPDAFAAADDLIAPPQHETELKEAVADLDAAPPPSRQPVAAAAETEATPQRRRSTIREPAPRVGAQSPAPHPEAAAPDAPAATNETAEADDQPRRTGWWSRRAGG
jgi:ribonuclease E